MVVWDGTPPLCSPLWWQIQVLMFGVVLACYIRQQNQSVKPTYGNFWLLPAYKKMLSLFIRVGPFLLQPKPFGIRGSEPRRRADPKAWQQGTGRLAAPGEQQQVQHPGQGRARAPGAIAGRERRCHRPAPPAHAHVTGSAERAAVGPCWAMASILDEYEDSLHRSVSVQPGRASVGIPHSGTCAPGPPVCGVPAERGRRGGSSGCCAACKRCVTVCATRLWLFFPRLAVGSVWRQGALDSWLGRVLMLVRPAKLRCRSCVGGSGLGCCVEQRRVLKSRVPEWSQVKTTHTQPCAAHSCGSGVGTSRHFAAFFCSSLRRPCFTVLWMCAQLLLHRVPFLTQAQFTKDFLSLEWFL